MHPDFFLVAGGGDFHHHIAELFTVCHPAQRIILQHQRVVVAIPQGKARGVFLGVGTQVFDFIHAMHQQRGFIGPEDGLVGLGEDHPI